MSRSLPGTAVDLGGGRGRGQTRDVGHDDAGADPRDRETSPAHSWFSGPAMALDRGTYMRLAQSLTAAE